MSHTKNHTSTTVPYVRPAPSAVAVELTERLLSVLDTIREHYGALVQPMIEAMADGQFDTVRRYVADGDYMAAQVVQSGAEHGGCWELDDTLNRMVSDLFDSSGDVGMLFDDLDPEQLAADEVRNARFVADGVFSAEDAAEMVASDLVDRRLRVAETLARRGIASVATVAS